jgi:CCR4-NOT transcription complex subunit 3
VQEGVELFESIYDKMMASTNSTQKDKCENDLKTQIKKLQRLRDQIKTWLTNSDIKDKTQLMDTRKLIETVRPRSLALFPSLRSRKSSRTDPQTSISFRDIQQMERFKATEKEMKTKAFSKEGLIAATKLDPAEKAKMETINWLSSMIDELSRQVEQAEAEVETLVAGQGKRKGRGPGGERAQELEHLNERRKWHIGRMELVQRMLDNGGIAVDKVNGTKEDISYFVESNTVSRDLPSLSLPSWLFYSWLVRFADLEGWGHLCFGVCRRRTLRKTRGSTTSSSCKRTTTCSA